jgi:hypothetical protein
MDGVINSRSGSPALALEPNTLPNAEVVEGPFEMLDDSALPKIDSQPKLERIEK